MNTQTIQQPINQNPSWLNELYKKYETKRLILERINPNDYEPLAKILLNKNVNYY